MAYDYKRYFGEIAALRDLTTMPEAAGWRTTERPIAIEHYLSVVARGLGIEDAFGPLPSARDAATSPPS